jgi:hypothetical protein
MAQQTAVEWLAEQMHDYDHAPASNNEEYVIIIPVWIFKDKVNTAKQMEKEQSKQDYDAGLFDGTMDEVKDRLHKNAEQYYNETYGKE